MDDPRPAHGCAGGTERLTISAKGLCNAFALVLGALNLLGGSVALILGADNALLAMIAGCGFIAAGVRGHQSAVRERSPAPRPPLVRRALPVLIFILGITVTTVAAATRDVDPRRSPQWAAPSIDNGYPLMGTGAGLRVALNPRSRVLAWRVHSDGTDNCDAPESAALWNFASGNVEPRQDGRFEARGRFRSDDRAIVNGRVRNFAKTVDYRIAGRLGGGQTANGTFWRRDRYYEGAVLRFTCVRSSDWSI